MSAEGGSVGTGEESGALSPKNKVKFLCSYGGKILPRPTDGQLKYVGGETRVIAVSPDITCSELMQKVTTLIDGDMVLKYQLLHQDLDSLVSVRLDEDLKHMFDEYDRHERAGAPMLRAFLFPSSAIVLENQAAVFEPHALEQRYIDAINGIIRTSPRARLSPIRVFSTSSACSSPKSNSPDGHTVETAAHESFSINSSCNSRAPMHRVRSSPSINSLSNLQNHSSSGFGSLNFQHYDHGHHHNHQHHPHYLSFRSPLDPHLGVGPGRPPSPFSMGKSDFGRSNGFSHQNPTSRQQRMGGSSKGGYYDECTAYAHVGFERTSSLPRNPRQVIWE